MRRTERLFQIIQILRGASRPLTGRELAEELEVSLRTLYRDIAELIAQRVPVRGEAGTGYVLDHGYDLPPLMLTPDELEAAVLGASWVAARGDLALQRSARDLIAKLTCVVPEALRPILLDAGARPISLTEIPADGIDLVDVRLAIRERRKLHITYGDAQDAPTQRVIWPLFIAYMETVRILVGWCELRDGFRHFRTDRIAAARLLLDSYPARRSELMARWQQEIPGKGYKNPRPAAADRGDN